MIDRLRVLPWMALLLWTAVGVRVGTARAADPCLECHGIPALGLERRPLAVDPDAYADGVHGRLTCADCHKGIDRFPHPPEARVRCDLPCHVSGASHEAEAQAVTGGVHRSVADPPCVACHGAGWPDPGGVEAVCRSCHEGMDRPRTRYPDTPGAFGAVAHERAERPPGCTDCHGFHGVGTGVSARASCDAGGCHPGAASNFGRLFDHGGDPLVPGWGGGGRLALIVGGVFLAMAVLHAARGDR